MNKVNWWLVIALVLGAGVALIAFARLWGSRQWQPVEGRMLRAQLRSFHNPTKVIAQSDSDTTDFEVDLDYEYEVNGQRYHGGRITAMGRNIFREEKDARAMLAQYPAGRNVTVYFAPDDPTQSCLVSGTAIPVRAFFGIALMLLLGIGVAILAVMVISGKLSIGEFIERIRTGRGT